MSAAVLLAVPAVPRAQAPAQDQAQTDLQPAQDIVARHVREIGGEEAFRQIRSIRLRGTFEITGQNVSGPIEVVSARPNLMRLRVSIPSVGDIEQGFDGTHGWSINPIVGPSLMSGRELDEFKDDAWFDGQLYGPEYIQAMETIGREPFDERDAWKVRITLRSGREQTEYFDVQTGLLIGSESRRQTEMGVVPNVAFMRDYKTFGRIKQPTLLVQRPLGIEQVVRVTEVEFDSVQDEAFEPPPAIKALIK